jgi:hypothetical protein
VGCLIFLCPTEFVNTRFQLEMPTSSRSLFAALSLVLASLVIVGCALEETDSESRRMSSCVDLSGIWTSGEYEALAVQLDGTNTVLSGLTMSLEVVQDDACHFRAVNTWSNGTVGGTEHVAGVVHHDDVTVTMLEVPNHPEGGSTARVHGRLVDGQLAWEYAGHTESGDQAIVFGTYLTQSGTAPTVACPDITGLWSSQDYDAFSVGADGTHSELSGLSMTFEVVHQTGCAFRGVNSWTNGEIGGVEAVAGLIHADGLTVSLVELGDHPDGGSSGRIFGRLNDGIFEWEYAGVDSEMNRGTVFSASLSRDGTWPARESCPDLLGEWQSEPYDALTVDAFGEERVLSNFTMTLSVAHQTGCHFRGENRWSDGDMGGSEPVVGVLHADGKSLTMVEVGEHPDGGSSAFVSGSLTEPDILHWVYGGVAADGSQAIVFATTLTR